MVTIKYPLFLSVYVHHHHFLQKPKTVFKADLVVPTGPTDEQLVEKTLNVTDRCFPAHIGLISDLHIDQLLTQLKLTCTISKNKYFYRSVIIRGSLSG